MQNDRSAHVHPSPFILWRDPEQGPILHPPDVTLDRAKKRVQTGVSGRSRVAIDAEVTMLKVITDSQKKRSCNEALKRNLIGTLRDEGKRKIGFQGGSTHATLYSAGSGKLWASFRGPRGVNGIERYWNAFGVFQPERSAQTILAEINIAATSNGSRVAGFFAEDTETGDIFLMHSGRIGGSRRGISKSAFLIHSKAKLIEVLQKHGVVRSGFIVGRLKDDDLGGRIWRFVRNVQLFKDQTGEIQTLEFTKRVEEFERYNKEFAGRKRGFRGGEFEYTSYHGDIVDRLHEERSAHLLPGERIMNSKLIDLLVKKDGVITEVYEVKTGVGRQMLYTAIGQLITHSAGREVAKYLVVPAEDDISADLKRAIKELGISMRRFFLKKTRSSREVRVDLET